VTFANYSQLQAAIATRLHRTDLTTQIVDYITLAEKRLNRLLQLSSAETETTLTATVSSRSLTMPTDFGTPLALYLTTYTPRQEVVYQTPEEMQVYADNGPCKFWTIDGTVIKVDVPADIAYTYALRYKSEFGIAASATNTLLTKYPDTYFYGALIEAANDSEDDVAAARYERRFAQAMDEVITDVNKQRQLATLRTDINTRSNRPNILRGY
jgi:hypothetical protein